VRVSFLLLVLALALSSACGTRPTTCRPDTCNGCCTMDDRCLAGTSSASCGRNGSTCDTCVSSQVCGVAGRCEAAPVVVVDAGVEPDAGTMMDAGVPTTGPITAPAERWTWVDFPQSACGNGSPTGLGVNLTTRSTDVIIYLQGGGACWSQVTCSLGFASDLDGYDGAQFAGDPTRGQGPFNRGMTTNPFRDASYVFIPYCTGDVHAGDTVAPYGIHHKGAANVRVFLDRLKETFPGQRRIFVVGVSAGGYGVQFNYFRFAEAFPQAEVHALADSAQMINPTGTLLTQFISAWGTSTPPGCTGCLQDFTRVPGWLSTTYPNRRFALLAFSRDNVLTPFLGYDDMGFQMATTGLLMSQYQGKANLKAYVVDPPMPSHVMLTGLFSRTVMGVPLTTWLNQFATGAPGWDNVRGP
jgi:hypothetical protein